MRRTWTIIGVADVARSCAWYQTLLGLPKSAPAHDYFGQILDADGTVLLCLHQWGTHGHPPLTRPDPVPGNGLLLFFRVDDFDKALPEGARAGIPARGGAAPEPKHGNDGVRPSGSGWLLRDGQCPLSLKCRASKIVRVLRAQGTLVRVCPTKATDYTHSDRTGSTSGVWP